MWSFRPLRRACGINPAARTITTEAAIARERAHAAVTYHPVPVVWQSAKGCEVTDVQGRKYLDFLAAYSAVNQGHCHPRIVKALVDQASTLSLSSRAFYSAKFGEFAAFASSYFGYDRILPMNSGAEAVETALKLTRKWGYTVKGIPAEQAIVVVCAENFHGRTISIVSMSTDPTTREGFGPYTPGFQVVKYGDLDDLKRVLDGPLSRRIAGFLVEPIQGEAGVKQARRLCADKRILFVTDEIQSGLGRAGKLLAFCHDNGAGAASTSHCGSCSCSRALKPDIVILGKALSGGMYPVSGVMADTHIMEVIGEGQHGSTFGGNAVASAVAMEALKVLRDEKLVENSAVQGERFRAHLNKGLGQLPFVSEVRGRGLFNAIEVVPGYEHSAWELCLALGERGILCKPTHDNIIRLTPPLCITAEQIDHASAVIVDTFQNASKLTKADMLADL